MRRWAATTARTDPHLPKPSLLSRIRRYRWLLALAAIVFLADQITKSWVFANIPFNTFGPPGHVEIIPGFFNLAHVGNTGAAWSLFTGNSVTLALLAGVTLVAIFVFRRQLALEHTGVQTCFGLLCGGILGNLVDRILHGHVIDFLDFRFGSYIYPTFNIADSGIVVGVLLYVIVSFRAAPAR